MNNIMKYGTVVSSVILSNGAFAACFNKNQKDQKREEDQKDSQKGQMRSADQKNQKSQGGVEQKKEEDQKIQEVKCLDEWVKFVFKDGNDVDLNKIDDYLDSFVKVCEEDAVNICKNVMKIEGGSDEDNRKKAKFYGGLVRDFIKKVWEESKNAKDRSCRKNISKLLKKEMLEDLMRCFSGILECDSEGKAVLKEEEIKEDAKNALKEIISMVYEIIGGNGYEGPYDNNDFKKYDSGFYVGYHKDKSFMILSGNGRDVGHSTGMMYWGNGEEADVERKKNVMLFNSACMVDVPYKSVNNDFALSCRKIPSSDLYMFEFVVGYMGSAVKNEDKKEDNHLKFEDKYYLFTTKNNFKDIKFDERGIRVD